MLYTRIKRNILLNASKISLSGKLRENQYSMYIRLHINVRLIHYCY